MSDPKRDSHGGAAPPRPSTSTLAPFSGSPPRSDHALSPPVPTFSAAAHPGDPAASIHTPLLGPMAQRNAHAGAAAAQMQAPALNIQAQNNPQQLAPMQAPHVAIPMPAPAPAAALAPAPRNYKKIAAQIATHGTDAAAAALSLSDAFAAQTPYVRSMTSGALWAASGPASAAANRGSTTAASFAADTLNTLAGGASMAATGLQTDHSTASSVMSYASNAMWAGAGLATMYSGKQKFSSSPGWMHWQTLSGGLQMASGFANTVAGVAGGVSTYLAETRGHNDPGAFTASVVSGAAWVAGSALGAFSTLTSPR